MTVITGFVRSDLDDTLIESLDARRKATLAILYMRVSRLRPGLEFGESFLKKTLELADGKDSLAHGWMEELNLPESFVDEVYAQANAGMIAQVISNCGPNFLLNSALEKLLDQGFVLAIHSHASENYCYDTLHGAGLSGYFEPRNIFHKGRVDHYKSNVEAHKAVQKALNKEHQAIADHYMIDNEVRNLLAAHFAGSRTGLKAATMPESVKDMINYQSPHAHEIFQAISEKKPSLLQKTG